jgi:hypothetical protein
MLEETVEFPSFIPSLGSHQFHFGDAFPFWVLGILNLPTDRTLTELTERRFAAFNIKK